MNPDINAGAIIPSDPPAIVGEQEAGRAAKVRKQINKIITQTNAAEFDLAELLHEVKTKNYYRDWGYDNFSSYADSLSNFERSKSYYLVKIVEAMKAAGLDRTAYESIGITKLRLISRLEPESEYNGVPGSLVINELTKKAGQMTAQELKAEVESLLGYTGDEQKVWLNFCLSKSVLENVVRPALEKIKKHLPQTEDEEGMHHDATDASALECICANFLADPNFDEPQPALTGEEPAYVVPPTEEPEPNQE